MQPSRRCVAMAVAAFVALTIQAWPAAAGTKDGKFAIEESGRATCGDFIKARDTKSPNYSRFIGFIDGYLTAANRYEPNTFDIAPWGNSRGYALILSQYCGDASRKTELLAIVAQRMVAQMAPNRLAEFSPLVAINAGGKLPLVVYETVLKRGQAALKSRKLYAGPIDGKFTPEVKTALEAFQKTAKIEPTGLPDSATMWALLNP